MTDRSIAEQHTAQYKRQLIQLMLFLCYFLSIPSHLSVEGFYQYTSYFNHVEIYFPCVFH